MSHSVDSIESLEQERFAAMVAGDTDTLDRLFSDDLVYTHSHGGRDTKASIIDVLKSGEIGYRTVERSKTSIRFAGDTAFVIGRAELGVSDGQRDIELDLHYLAVWVLGADGWKFEAWQSTGRR